MMKKLPVSRGLETHPYPVSDLTGLPASLQQAAQQALGPTEQPLSTFAVPAQSFLKNWFSQRHVPPQALLFTAQGVLHLQEATSPDQPAQTTFWRAADLLYIQLRLLLLYGRLELAGQTDGVLTKVVVEFNTVGTWLLLPGLRHLLRLTWAQAETEAPAAGLARVALPEFQKLPLKFKNGLQLYGLQPGEYLLGVIFQPGIWQHYRPFFHHQVSANTLLALTDHELIIVEEDRTGEQSPYGWILTFCPLASISRIETVRAETRPALQLRLARDGVVVDRQVTLEPETALAWQNLWAHSHAAGS